MPDDDFTQILQSLQSGQTPTPTTNSSGTGIVTSERGDSPGTKQVYFGLSAVTEGKGPDRSADQK